MFLSLRHSAMRGALMLSVTVSVLAPAACAQSDAMTSATPSRLTIEELTAQWASLERPLLGVTELTDLQRDAIERLETQYRRILHHEAGPIRFARPALEANSLNVARRDVAVALERMASLRTRQLESLRKVLTDAQRVMFDANLQVLAAEEAEASDRRERDAVYFYSP